jgi:hypothetical protein
MASGFAPNFPGPDSACFYLDPEAGMTSGNLWVDSSPQACHVTPVGFAAPTYGLGRSNKGSPYIRFNGSNQRGTLNGTDRFYAKMSQATDTLTIAAVCKYTSYSDPAAAVFDCRPAAVTRGLVLYVNVADLRLNGGDAAGVTWEFVSSPYAIFPKTRVDVFTTTMSGWRYAAYTDDKNITTTLAAAKNPISYDAARVPEIGRFINLNRYLGFDLFFLGIWPMVFSDREVRALSQFWRDRL